MNTFTRVIVNQPILTEDFNLIDTLNNTENYNLNQHLVARINRLSESTSSNGEILGMASFNKFGFSDASIDLLASYYLVLTDDLKLYGYLSSGESQQLILIILGTLPNSEI